MPNIIRITDFSAPELDIFARKTENQLLNREHPAEGIFIQNSFCISHYNIIIWRCQYRLI